MRGLLPVARSANFGRDRKPVPLVRAQVAETSSIRGRGRIHGGTQRPHMRRCRPTLAQSGLQRTLSDRRSLRSPRAQVSARGQARRGHHGVDVAMSAPRRALTVTRGAPEVVDPSGQGQVARTRARAGRWPAQARERGSETRGGAAVSHGGTSREDPPTEQRVLLLHRSGEKRATATTSSSSPPIPADAPAPPAPPRRPSRDRGRLPLGQPLDASRSPPPCPHRHRETAGALRARRGPPIAAGRGSASCTGAPASCR
jgi:hypothetical protein